ncbi:electron transfer flavoprotein-ubiquinone oxidoreductase [Pseudoxanthomonas winnipegensis]|uniref:Electron transfer flavoprotein-ubiquinone oxidoreductase n=1 Tax=Pseudoxanthomonas winnipegensis TaxID=2480810 RepID=A0A4V2HDM3_9GAMM|nr:electron transfer flavoprotein-ubiquinone oxidoreductase [Pseudoxanthomonas winnipegensis]RZZ88959.1 electron transfer flavoprotein-ubiquinone oxidoreductase [Pseudoxanthomonas winnipegensis]TAA27332.1 electron transfer flavoprotein-ubiquinone oxidoreductase [Pseudoxanthomonas winnipegensis]TAA38955.1 electron transfer flavoprotein-ubiquinone oxidoreductase [Pseudoxanthomonas winnipegensis]TBV75618.1 electron transfer flavoprotein-ubiquinone oxidoreductase [Pseudoxanthomonas winnipegensis]
MTPDALLAQYGPRESMEYDVVVVGAGPGGLATAIRLKQLAAEAGRDVSVCVLEKGSEPGAHILSGAIMDPRALTELFPDWKEKGAPLKQPVTEDQFLFLSDTGAKATPHALLPECFHNQGNYIISLGALTRWLSTQAEGLGVEIFPGFAATEILYTDAGAVKGVATGNMGLGKDGEPTVEFQLGMELHAKYTIFAEGSRGQLGRQLLAKFSLDAGKDPQAYGLGIKELWQIDPAKHTPGLVVHTAGWPLDADTYGGSFLYHAEDGKVAIGLVVGLDYKNPWLSPFEEFQRFKTHPAIRKYLEGGKRIGYGARSITAGGLMSLPKLVFPGGALVGCEAGTLNASRIKGSHAAIKTGMLAAEAAFAALGEGRSGDELSAYPAAFEASWLYAELQQSKNFKQWFKKGRTLATLMTGIEQWLLPKLGIRNPPWTLRHSTPDHACLEPANQHQKIAYPKPDGQLTFDRLSSVFLSSTNHDEDQPAHLTLKDPAVPVEINLATYAGPEARYCPAGVYEFVAADGGGQRLQINAQNCVHCKTCDIKDPTQNIVWVAPQGGGGPNYAGM